MGLSVKDQMLRFTKMLRGVVEDAGSKEVMTEVGEQAIKLVQQQAKMREDYTGGNFTKLSRDYIERRGELGVHPRGRTDKSNVTASGQMVDSLKLAEVMARSVTIEAAGMRKRTPYDGKKGKLKTNAEVAYWVEKNGRHWLGLTEKSKVKLQKFFERIVTSMVRRQDRK